MGMSLVAKVSTEESIKAKKNDLGYFLDKKHTETIRLSRLFAQIINAMFAEVIDKTCGITFDMIYLTHDKQYSHPEFIRNQESSAWTR